MDDMGDSRDWNLKNVFLCKTIEHLGTLRDIRKL